MQTQAGLGSHAGPGCSPSSGNFGRSGVRHTLVLLFATPHGLQDLRSPNPGHSSGRAGVPTTAANRELGACSLFLLLLKNIVTTVE